MKSKNKGSSDRDEREYLAGKIRALEKRLRAADRENARLSKQIRQLQANENDEGNDEDGDEQAAKVCGKSGCKSTTFYELKTPRKHYSTCKQCGNRSHVERNLDANGQ